MTTGDVLGAVLRRWYLVLLGAALSLAAVSVATQQQGVWFTQFNVILIPPAEDADSNYLESTPFALHPAVGVVVSAVNDGDPPLLTASSATTLVGQGVRQGIQVRTVNQGSQWNPVFRGDFMDVQVADDSPEAVASGARLALARIDRSLQELQDEAGVPRNLRINALASSTDPPVRLVQGSRSRAAGATALVGATTTITLVVWVDTLILRQRRRKADIIPHGASIPVRDTQDR